MHVCSYTHLYKYPQGCSNGIPSSSITKNPGHTCFYYSHQTKRRNETISGWEVQWRTFLSVSVSVSKCFWTADSRSKNLLTKKAASALEDRDKLCCPQAQVLFHLLYPSSLLAMKGKAAWGCGTCQELQCPHLRGEPELEVLSTSGLCRQSFLLKMLTAALRLQPGFSSAGTPQFAYTRA